MRALRNLFARVDAWLDAAVGYIESPAPDPLLSPRVAPHGHDHAAHDILDSIFEHLRTREGCPHWSAAAVELDIPPNDQVFHCTDCGLTYRHEVDAAKPWLIVGYVPVEVAS